MVGGGKVIEQAVICPTTPLYDPFSVRQRNINVFLGLQLSFPSSSRASPTHCPSKQGLALKYQKFIICWRQIAVKYNLHKCVSRQSNCWLTVNVQKTPICHYFYRHQLSRRLADVDKCFLRPWGEPLSQEEMQFFLCLSTILKISLACRWFWRYIYLHVLTILEMSEDFGFGFALK